MDKINVGFLGYGTRALDALMEDGRFEVKRFIAPMSRLCEDVYTAKRRYRDLDFAIVRNNEELLAAFRESEGVDCYVMNACPIILKRNALEVMPVYNIHPGSLRHNRGHQPHLWTVLLGEPESEIVLHTVTAGIDEGAVIGRQVCPIGADMDALSVLNLLEDRIPALLDSLYEHLAEGKAPLAVETGGTYRRVMVHSDYAFSPEDMEQDLFLEDVLRKIRARAMHHGAFFVHNGERVYVDRLLDDERVPSGKMLSEKMLSEELPVEKLSSGELSVEKLSSGEQSASLAGAEAACRAGVSGSAADHPTEVSFHGSVVFLEHAGRRLVFHVNKREAAEGE